MTMQQFFLNLSFLLCCITCCATDEKAYNQDTTINGKLTLWNDFHMPNISRITNDTMDITNLLMNSDTMIVNATITSIFGEVPHILFFNEDNSEFLFATPYYGTCAKCFLAYYIGYTRNIITEDIKYIETKEQTFHTESGMHLGMSIEEVINIKGKAFYTKNNMFTYYFISPAANNDIDTMKYYKDNDMGDMFMTIVSDNGIVIGIAFGYMML